MLLISLHLCGGRLLFAAGVAEYPEVLIINSYAPGYAWNEEVLSGLLGQLRKVYPGMEPIIHHMDAKRFPEDVREEWLLKDLVYKSRLKRPKLIISMDDAAFSFTLRHRDQLGRGIPIVFGGVNHFEPSMIQGQADITGVSEQTDFKGTFDLIRRLCPATRNILVISTDTDSGRESTRSLLAVMPQYEGSYSFEIYDRWTQAELVERVSRLPADTVGFLIECTRDINGEVTYNNPEFSRALATRSRVPLFTNAKPPASLDYQFHPWSALGGGLIIAEQHGVKVGELALRVLAGEPAGSIPVVLATPERLEVDYHQMRRFGFSEKQLPPGTHIANIPEDLYQINRTHIIQVLFLIFALSGTVLILVLNIWRRRRAERELLRSQERLDLVARATNEAIWDHDIATGNLWWNESYENMFRTVSVPADKLERWRRRALAGDRLRVQTAFAEGVSAGNQVLSLEYRFERPGMEPGHAYERVYLQRSPSGALVRATGSVMDVSQLRQAQSELQLLATAVSQASDMVLIIAVDSRLLYANPAFKRITGRGREETKGQGFDAFWSANTANPHFEDIRRSIESEQAWNGRFEFVSKEGKPCQLQVSISPLRDETGAVFNYLFMGRDISREMKLEEQLRSSQKMEAIGLLAGGIAHDFNNILQVILGHGTLLLEDSTDPKELREGLEIMHAAAGRAAQLTRQLLLFSRKQELRREPVELGLLISELLRMIRRLIGVHIEVSFSAPTQPLLAMVDKGQLEQVLLNLCVNARDAMGDGGLLAIELQARSLSQPGGNEPAGLPPGEYAVIRVRDNGCGIPTEIQAHLFEPFFTTKSLGKGTGLGLSVAYGIMTQHGGGIHVESAPGEGSCFTLYLPLGELAERSAPSSEIATESRRGSGLVLLAEDDPQIQRLAERILVQNGFEVLLTGDGVEALQALERHAENVRLVILDVLMPKKGGRQVYDELRVRRPGMPVLFCSGYSAEMLPRDLPSEPKMSLVKKPYTREELLGAVHALLDTEG